MRIVSTTCSNTEIVCALGCAHFLVGVDRHSDFPVDVVARLPRVGSDLQIDVEAVRALRPDLVLASLTVPGHERVVAALNAAGLRVVAPEPISVADTCRDIRDIASLLGVRERGEVVARELEACLATPDPKPPLPPGTITRAPRILVEWWPKPVIVPGRQSWVTDLLRAAGAVNPWGELDVKSTPVDDAAVVAAAPDAVVIAWCGVEPRNYKPEQVYRRAAWAEVPALRDRQVHAIPEAFLGRPGPRLKLGLAALRRLVADWERRRTVS
ncbi:MAG: ABC transporter substrate-binding protein [Planctomycetota bacterium]